MLNTIRDNSPKLFVFGIVVVFFAMAVAIGLSGSVDINAILGLVR